MSCALVTLAIGEKSNQLLLLAEPFFKAYCNKLNIDYILINENIINGYSAHLEKFQLFEIMHNYERTIYIDSDIIIHPNSPNILKLVPENHIGAIYDNYSNSLVNNNRKKEINSIQHSLGNIGWKRSYVNSGVLIMSKQHRIIFTNPEDRMKFKSAYNDQTLINYNILKNNFKLHILDEKFNGMEFNGFSSRYINFTTKQIGSNKLDAYFMHFANEGDKLLQMFKTTKLLLNVISDIDLKIEVEKSLNILEPIIKSMNQFLLV